VNIAGYDHDEPMIYGKLAIDAHDAKIRAAALRDSANMIRSMGRSPMVNKEFAAQCLERGAILAGEVKE